MPALGLFLSGGLLWEQRADLAYLFSSAQPIELGQAGDYHLERAAAASFARISGRPALEVSHYRKGLFDRELVPLVDAPVLVDRPRAEPTPASGVFEGRLEPDIREPQLAEVIRYFLEKDELAPPGARTRTSHVWILTVGQRPWRPGWSALWCLALFGLVGFNAAWLARRLER